MANNAILLILCWYLFVILHVFFYTISFYVRLYSFSSGCGLRGQPPVVAIELKLTARKPQSQWESSGRRMRNYLL